MFLPLLAPGGVLLQGSLTVGHNSGGTTTVTVSRGYAAFITDTPGSFSATFNALSSLTGIYQYSQSGAGSNTGIVVLCSQLTGVSTISVWEPDTQLWYPLTWNGSTGYDNGTSGDTFGWNAGDTGTVKTIMVRAG